MPLLFYSGVFCFAFFLNAIIINNYIIIIIKLEFIFITLALIITKKKLTKKVRLFIIFFDQILNYYHSYIY